MLAGIAVRELFRVVWSTGWDEFKTRPFKPGAALALWSLAVSPILVSMPGRIGRAAASVAYGENAQENAIVRRLVRHHAGLPVPPEAAVIPSKRIWSGQFDGMELVRILNEYRPEQVVLISSKWMEAIGGHLDQHYVPLGENEAEFHLHRGLRPGRRSGG